MLTTIKALITSEEVKELPFANNVSWPVQLDASV